MTHSIAHLKIVCMIAKIDAMISAQLSQIIHHDDFHDFESRWRSLNYLIDQTAVFANVKIKVLNASKVVLQRDLCQQIAFDQSVFFRLVYSDEFGHPGGEPFNLIISDMQFTQKIQDVDLLNEIGQVAAAAFCPFVAGIHPHFFGIDDMETLAQLPDIAHIDDGNEYADWQRLRAREDNRFLALTVGRFLLRKPQTLHHQAANGFCFRDPNAHRGYLWACGAFALATVAARAFDQYGWFANMIGHQAQSEGGGLIPTAKSAELSEYEQLVLKQFPAEVGIPSMREIEYADLGLIPICQTFPWCENVFYSCQTLHKPKCYNQSNASDNAKMSVKLNYLLCASRFAHYIHIIARDKIGSYATAMECEYHLTEWLFRYTANNEVSLHQRSEFPLQQSQVIVKEVAAKPGYYRCTVHLKPHFQLENISAVMTLTSELGS